MKENSKVSELTLGELQKRQTMLKAVVIVSSIIILFLIGVFIYFLIVTKTKNYSYYWIFGILSANSLFCSAYLKQIEAEIKSRNSQS